LAIVPTGASVLWNLGLVSFPRFHHGGSLMWRPTAHGWLQKRAKVELRSCASANITRIPAKSGAEPSCASKTPFARASCKAGRDHIGDDVREVVAPGIGPTWEIEHHRNGQ